MNEEMKGERDGGRENEGRKEVTKGGRKGEREKNE